MDKALLRLYRMHGASIEDIIKVALEESINIAKSKIGFIGFLNENETIMNAYVWSQYAMKNCRMDNKPVEFRLKNAGHLGRSGKAAQTGCYKRLFIAACGGKRISRRVCAG